MFAALHGDFAIHRLKQFPARREWASDETHTCRNLSGHWVPAAPSLAARYNMSALVEGEVFDAQDGFIPMTRKSKPWTWQRNDSVVPALLVFREDASTAAKHLLLPTADMVDWSEAFRGRVVIFIGDSLASYQALNLLHLVSDRRTTSIESSRRHWSPTSGESLHQTSWCRAVCTKVRGAWSKSNRCREVHTVVCWLSAGKSESPSMMRRTLALVTTWAFGSLASLTRRDVIVGSYGHHFLPWDKEVRLLSQQLETFIEVCKWHAQGRWRKTVDANDEVAYSKGIRGVLPPTWRRRVPHMLYREANPQFWQGGVFPGRAGTSSKKRDCLPPWEYEEIQRAHRQQQPSSSPLDHLLGPRAYAAYNAASCTAVAHSPVGLLRAWLPSALLGSRDSSVVGDCTHSYLYGSTNAFWNQLLLHAVWRRERRQRDKEAPSSSWSASRLETWNELQRMLERANENVAGRDRARDGSYGGVCGKYARTNGTYRPFPQACCTEASPVQKCGHTAFGHDGLPPSRLRNVNGKVVRVAEGKEGRKKRDAHARALAD